MKNLSLAGRILYALPFLLMGINHIFMLDVFEGMATSFIPGAGFTIIFVGLVLIATSISIMLKKYVTLSCYILAGLLFLFIATIHLPSLVTGDKNQSVMAMINLFKDTGLLGGSLLIAAMHKEEAKPQESQNL